MGLIKKTRTRQAYTRIRCILDLALPNHSVETDAPNSGTPLTSSRWAVLDKSFARSTPVPWRHPMPP
jgi:hypothetical protein